eukprot:15443137-Alexandrium_andersonii.AAC.1
MEKDMLGVIDSILQGFHDYGMTVFRTRKCRARGVNTCEDKWRWYTGYLFLPVRKEAQLPHMNMDTVCKAISHLCVAFEPSTALLDHQKQCISSCTSP